MYYITSPSHKVVENVNDRIIYSYFKYLNKNKLKIGAKAANQHQIDPAPQGYIKLDIINVIIMYNPVNIENLIGLVIIIIIDSKTVKYINVEFFPKFSHQ
jgi:hypothetical protein